MAKFTIPNSVIWAILSVLSVAEGAAAAAPPAATDELLFFSNRLNSRFMPYRMSPDGKHVTRVFADLREAGDEISWSPDGQQVLYTSTRDGRFQNIFVTNLLDEQSRQLTRDPLPATNPAWAPDGRSIAYVSSRDGSRRLYVMDSNGNNQRRVTKTDGLDEINPVFSPDGSKIAYLSIGDSGLASRIAVADLRSGKASIVSVNTERSLEASPAWSPDSSQLLFTVIKGQTSHLYVMGADGSNRTRLTKMDGRHGGPQWSPDGKQVLYLAIPSDSARQGLYVMDATGSNVEKLRGGDHDVMDARWSADGKHIYFVQQLDEGGKIFSLDRSTGLVSRLSGNEGFDVGIRLCCGNDFAKRTVAQQR